ncbi:hypothetical protein [Shimazuella alba]|uniref:Uncharacterized protein n=1 Tax=Shimazuella alba TaxID=2690964 RepID=A0A6I4VZH5_9BACL|nr:hypothetical protein [Shimazuella alba]MXQ53512.1 hypothetical protein [Shimazuella alba]
MLKKQVSFFSLVLYALSALVMVYAIWAFVYSYNSISEAIAAGQISPSENVFDIVNFYMSNSMNYVLFAVLIFSAGWIGQNLAAITKAASIESFVKEAKVNDEEENLDEWLDELQNRKSE